MKKIPVNDLYGSVGNLEGRNSVGLNWNQSHYLSREDGGQCDELYILHYTREDGLSLPVGHAVRIKNDLDHHNYTTPQFEYFLDVCLNNNKKRYEIDGNIHEKFDDFNQKHILRDIKLELILNDNINSLING